MKESRFDELVISHAGEAVTFDITYNYEVERSIVESLNVYVIGDEPSFTPFKDGEERQVFGFYANGDDKGVVLWNDNHEHLYSLSYFEINTID